MQRLSSGGPWEKRFGYSRAVVVPPQAAASGTRVVLSGCTATVDGVVQHPGDAHAQALVAIDVIAAALARVGGTLADVVRTRIYLVSGADAEPVGLAHGERFADAPPAMTMLVVAGFVDPTMLVEIEAEALVATAEPAGS